MMNSITLNGVSKRFGDKTVLRDVSLGIAQGELFGLLGPSGAGKTTLIKILTGQLPYEGNAELWGKGCGSLNREVYRNIGMVLDNSGLYDRLSCYDNLMMFARINKVNKGEVLKVLDRVGLADARRTPAGKLSKGMRQRLTLARALLHKPKLLFLDEPTSGLDPATAQEIHSYLLELKNSGTTIFLTTHNMEEAYKLCDHIALLNEGGIVEYGVPEELCRRYNVQNRVSILCRDGKTVELENRAENAGKIAGYFSAGMVESIHSSEPSLGTVFMALTGRGLA